MVQYTYGDTNWKDKLTAYNGNAITYDEIGNPITYYNGNNFEWDKGRSLIRANKPDGTYMSYRYNESGIRTRKTVNGTPTFYFLDGNDIIAQQTGNTTYWFDYDATGNRHSMEYNGNIYYYYYNLQGDVIGLYDSDLNVVVNYTYDSWGKVLSITGSMADTLGQANPFRYRGYYYDTESGLYYLNSRYYDPEVGRFINADGYVSTDQGVLGNNLFAYCGDNPVNRVDPTGQFWSEIWEFAKTVVNEIGKAMGAMSYAYTWCGGVAAVDGLLPFGDIVGLAGVTLITTYAIGYGICQAAQAPAISFPKAEEKDEVISAPPPSNGTTYYHVTTPDNATAIMATGVMTGSKWESGYVYAWKTNPSKYAIENSGAHKGVTISFKTSASFVMDTGITDPKVQMCGPVVSTMPGPIVVWDVQIVG